MSAPQPAKDAQATLKSGGVQGWFGGAAYRGGSGFGGRLDVAAALAPAEVGCPPLAVGPRREGAREGDARLPGSTRARLINSRASERARQHARGTAKSGRSVRSRRDAHAEPFWASGLQGLRVYRLARGGLRSTRSRAIWQAASGDGLRAHRSVEGLLSVRNASMGVSDGNVLGRFG